MPNRNKADITFAALDGSYTYDFRLYGASKDPLQFKPRSLFANRFDITGRPGAQNLESDLLQWNWTDGSGGEGNEFYTSQQAAVYSEGQVNSRIIGRFAPMPDVTESTFDFSAAPTSGRFQLTNAGGKLWALGEGLLTPDAYFSSDGVNWDQVTFNPATATQTIWAADGDLGWVYYALYDSNNPTHGGPARLIKSMNEAGNHVFSTPTGTVNPKGYMALCLLPPYIYAMTPAGTVFFWDTTNNAPGMATEDETLIYAVGPDITTDAKYRLVAGANAIYGMVNVEGNSTLFRVLAAPTGGGQSLDGYLPRGFQLVDICYTLGILVLLGVFNGVATLIAMDDNLAVKALRQVRPDTAYRPITCAPGPGTQVLFAMSPFERTPTGPSPIGSMDIFVWDLDAAAGPAGSISLLYNIDSDTVKAEGDIERIVTFQGNRVTSQRKDATDNIKLYDDDRLGSGTTGNFQTPDWDFDLPSNSKILTAIKLVYLTLPPGSSISVEYQTEKSGNWVPIAEIADEDGSTSKEIDLSALDISFNLIRFRVTLTSATLYSAVIQAYVPDFISEWTATLDIKDSTADNRGTNEQRTGWEKRDFLRSAHANKEVISFTEHARYPLQTNTATSVNVIIADLEDHIINPGTGEGYAVVRVREVP